MSKTVLIGCKLPSGIVLNGTRGDITINGTNTSHIHGGVGLTHVDATEWAYLSGLYAEHSAFKSQSVFAYESSNKVADVLALADELSDEKTGFEGLDPNKPAPGLKPEDEGKLKVELNKNEGVKVPTKKAGSKQDQAAALEAAIDQDK